MSVENNIKAFLSYIPDLQKSRTPAKNKIWTGQVREYLNQLNLTGTDMYQMNSVLNGLESDVYGNAQYESADLFLKMILQKGLKLKNETITTTNTPRPPIDPMGTTMPMPTVTSRMIEVREKSLSKLIPVEKSQSVTSSKLQTTQNTESNRIFIVHGHDDTSKLELARMIERMGLDAIILHEKPNEGKTLIEKFEAHSKDVNFAFVLITPDDVGGKDKDHLNKRARQNVILELGFFIAKLGRSRVCCLHKSEVEVPTDYSGVTFLPFKESLKECHEDIIRELKTAGYNLKI